DRGAAGAAALARAVALPAHARCVRCARASHRGAGEGGAGMRLVRVAVASVNTTVGALGANVDRAVRVARAAAQDGATVVALPEQCIGGYAPEDLVQWRRFVDAQKGELARFAAETADLGAAFALGITVARGAHLYNSAALVHKGKVRGYVPKEKLPTYN